MKLFTLPWNFLLFYLAKSGISWWYVFYFCSCWLTSIYSNASYGTFLLERWKYFACLCPQVYLNRGRQWEDVFRVAVCSSLCSCQTPVCMFLQAPLSSYQSCSQRWTSPYCILMKLLKRKEAVWLQPKMIMLQVMEEVFERFFARWFTQEWINPWLPSQWNLEEKEEKEM